MFSNYRNGYTVLEKSDLSDCTEDASEERPWRHRQIPLVYFLTALGVQTFLWALSVVLVYSIMRGSRPREHYPLDDSYHDALGNSYPAAEAISYETVTFSENKSYMSSIDGSTPSIEVDKRWEELQAPVDGMIQAAVHKGFEIERLPVTNISRVDPRYHVYGLEVFHQLHCLDRIRKTFHAEHYFPNETQEEIIWHREHCIDHLRQGVMCSGDIALDRWEYDPEIDMSWLKTDVPHVCRNFQGLSDWVRKFRFHAKDWTLFNETGRDRPLL